MPTGVYQRNEHHRKILSDSAKGRVISMEAKRKISLSLKGKVVSSETRKKISLANTGKIRTKEMIENLKKARNQPEVVKKIFNSHIGVKLSKKTKIKISKANKGRKRTEEHKKLLSKLAKQRGSGKWMLGRKLSEETKRKVGEAKSGEKHWNWRGGISCEPYSLDWTQTLKRSIRERDKYICFTCKILQGDIAFDVHHIDYNKQNCNPENLITLCKSCHTKTNTNREIWKQFFQPLFINNLEGI
jgi:hypothetical protein